MNSHDEPITAPSDEPSVDADAESLPRPTYAPAALAMATCMSTWGLLTHWTMSLFGGGLLVWALATWMNEIRREWEES